MINSKTLSVIGKFSAVSYLQSVVGILTTVLLARFLGPEIFGGYAFCIVIINIVSTVAQFGMERTLVKDIVKSDDSIKVLLTATFLKLLLILCICTVSYFYIQYFYNLEIDLYLLIYAITVGFVIALTPQAYFDCLGKIQLHASVSLLSKLIYGIFALLVSLSFAADNRAVTWLVILLLLTRVLFLLFEWKYIIDRRGLDNLPSLSNLFELSKSNMWVWLAVIGNLMMSQGNQILLAANIGLKELSYYALAFQIVMIVRLFQAQVVRLFSPKIASTMHSSVAKAKLGLYFKSTLFVFVTSFVFCFSLYFLAPWLILNIFGEQYQGSAPIVKVLAIWALIVGIGGVNSQFIFSLNLEVLYFLITILFGILSLAVTYFLLGHLGVLGAAISLLICHGLSTITLVIVVSTKIIRL